CYRYYQCVNGFPYPMVCPDNTWFDATRDVCDNPANVECVLEPGQPTVPPTPNICDNTANNRLTPNPTACNKYYICVNQIGWSKICPLNMWFDEEGQTCAPAGTVDCPLGPPIPPETTTTPFSRCDDVANLRFVRNEDYCYRYYQCRNGVPFPLICPRDQWFSEEMQRCVDQDTIECEIDHPPPPVSPTPGICNDAADGEMVLHPLHCNQYYLCVNRIGLPTTCPLGQWFDEQSQSCNNPLCDRSEYVECDATPPPIVRPPGIDGICDDVADGHLSPHHTFCNEFFLCVREIGWPLICPPGLWFNEEEQTCSIGGTVSCDLAPQRPPVTESPYAIGSPFPMICPNEQWFDALECIVEEEPPRPPPTAGICNGVSNAIQVPNPRACNQFYVCVDEIGFPQICGPGLWFNEDQQTCLPPGEASCELGPPTTTTVTTPSPYERCHGEEDNRLLRNDFYCYRYYQCIDEVAYPMICRPGRWFDLERQVCDLSANIYLCSETTTTSCVAPDQVECPHGLRPTPSPIEGICDGVTSGTKVPNPEDCTWFYICVQGRPYASPCGEGMAFDKTLLTCVPEADAECADVVTTVP
ncbi:AAEL000585-PA, partial [Aedes aegypti]